MLNPSHKANHLFRLIRCSSIEIHGGCRTKKKKQQFLLPRAKWMTGSKLMKRKLTMKCQVREKESLPRTSSQGLWRQIKKTIRKMMTMKSL